MNNKKGGIGAKILLVLILMIASAVGGAYGYRVLDGKLASRDALKAVENVDISDYDTAEQTVIQGFVDEAKRNLETAKTRKEVYDVISEFIADVDKVQTANEKKLEEALREAEEAKKQYSSNNNNYNNNNSNGLFNSNNNNNNNNNNDNNSNQNSDQYDQSYNNNQGSEQSDSSYDDESDDSSDNGSYKSNDLTNADDGEEENNGGFLNSLLGGLASDSNGN